MVLSYRDLTGSENFGNVDLPPGRGGLGPDGQFKGI